MLVTREKCNACILYYQLGVGGIPVISQYRDIITQWLLTPTDSVNKSHHELLTPLDHVNLCTHFHVATSMVGAQATKG